MVQTSFENGIGEVEHGDFADLVHHRHVDSDGELRHVHDSAPAGGPRQPYLNLAAPLVVADGPK